MSFEDVNFIVFPINKKKYYGSSVQETQQSYEDKQSYSMGSEDDLGGTKPKRQRIQFVIKPKRNDKITCSK